jgi:hypothetical protein
MEQREQGHQIDKSDTCRETLTLEERLAKRTSKASSQPGFPTPSFLLTIHESLFMTSSTAAQRFQIMHHMFLSRLSTLSCRKLFVQLQPAGSAFPILPCVRRLHDS